MTHLRHWTSLLDLGLSFPEPEDWTVLALCAQVDGDLFFPEKGGSTREAKRICQGCEVREQCLAFAVEHQVRFGVWGGLSERERRPFLAVTPGFTERAARAHHLSGQGLTIREIAAEMGASERSVRDYLHYVIPGELGVAS